MWLKYISVDPTTPGYLLDDDDNNNSMALSERKDSPSDPGIEPRGQLEGLSKFSPSHITIDMFNNLLARYPNRQDSDTTQGDRKGHQSRHSPREEDKRKGEETRGRFCYLEAYIDTR